MIDFKEQRKCEFKRKMDKKIMRYARRMKKVEDSVPELNVRFGNKDFGVPFHGKDTFSGQRKKMADRIYEEEVERDGETIVINRLLVYVNNKYNGDGTLKELL